MLQVREDNSHAQRIRGGNPGFWDSLVSPGILLKRSFINVFRYVVNGNCVDQFKEGSGFDGGL